jgi:hypothetical protein
MPTPIDIARALKDKSYFNSLTPDEQKQVREAGGVGGDLTDSSLESVSGGLEGGDTLAYTSSSGCASSSVSVVTVVTVVKVNPIISCIC